METENTELKSKVGGIEGQLVDVQKENSNLREELAEFGQKTESRK